jgi:hypothetical protein
MCTLSTISSDFVGYLFSIRLRFSIRPLKKGIGWYKYLEFYKSCFRTEHIDLLYVNFVRNKLGFRGVAVLDSIDVFYPLFGGIKKGIGEWGEGWYKYLEFYKSYFRTEHIDLLYVNFVHNKLGLRGVAVLDSIDVLHPFFERAILKNLLYELFVNAIKEIKKISREREREGGRERERERER